MLQKKGVCKAKTIILHANVNENNSNYRIDI